MEELFEIDEMIMKLYQIRNEILDKLQPFEAEDNSEILAKAYAELGYIA